MASPARGTGQQGDRERRGETEEPKCLWKLPHLCNDGKKSSCRQIWPGPPNRLLGGGGTQGFCLWVSVCTASRELGDPHPLCLPAPDFSSESVQGMREAASPKPCSRGRDSLSPQIQGEDDGGRVDLWEPLEKRKRKGIRSGSCSKMWTIITTQ